jgi:hypothetical protein
MRQRTSRTRSSSRRSPRQTEKARIHIGTLLFTMVYVVTLTYISATLEHATSTAVAIPAAATARPIGAERSSRSGGSACNHMAYRASDALIAKWTLVVNSGSRTPRMAKNPARRGNERQTDSHNKRQTDSLFHSVRWTNSLFHSVQWCRVHLLKSVSVTEMTYHATIQLQTSSGFTQPTDRRLDIMVSNQHKPASRGRAAVGDPHVRLLANFGSTQ